MYLYYISIYIYIYTYNDILYDFEGRHEIFENLQVWHGTKILKYTSSLSQLKLHDLTIVFQSFQKH